MADALRRRNGDDVRAVYDGAEALRVAEEYRPDALISDIHMPGINGFQLVEAFAERFPGCNAVLITMDSALLEWPCDGRVYRVLRKPVDLEDLVQFLATCRPPDAS